MFQIYLSKSSRRTTQVLPFLGLNIGEDEDIFKERNVGGTSKTVEIIS